MNIDRKWIYASVVLSYYVFVTVFGLRTGLFVLTSTIAVGAISYAWFLFAVSRSGGAMLVDLKDLAVNVGICSFISFFVIFIDYQISVSWYGQYHILKPILGIASVVMWIGIWIDFYIQRINGRM